MPQYEYTCRSCTVKFDLLRKVDERDLPVRCPECGAEDKEPNRNISPASFQLVGGGWAKDGYSG